MEFYARPTEPSPATYSSARHAATRWRTLVERDRDSERGFDIAASYAASFQAGGKAFTWTPIDGQEELDQLRAVFRMAVEDATRERGGVAARWWRAWRAHRIDGVALSARPGGFAKSHLSATVIPVIDEHVEDALDWFDLLDRPNTSPVGAPDMLPNNGNERYVEDGALVLEIHGGVDDRPIT